MCKWVTCNCLHWVQHRGDMKRPEQVVDPWCVSKQSRHASLGTTPFIYLLDYCRLLIQTGALLRHFLKGAIQDMCSPCKLSLFWQDVRTWGLWVRCVCVWGGGIRWGSLGVRIPTFQGLVVVSPVGSRGARKKRIFVRSGPLVRRQNRLRHPSTPRLFQIRLPCKWHGVNYCPVCDTSFHGDFKYLEEALSSCLLPPAGCSRVRMQKTTLLAYNPLGYSDLDDILHPTHQILNNNTNNNNPRSK